MIVVIVARLGAPAMRQSAGFVEKEQGAFRPRFSASRDILSQTLASWNNDVPA